MRLFIIGLISFLTTGFSAIASGSVFLMTEGHSGGINALSISRDTSMLLSASADKSAVLRRLSNAEYVNTIYPPAGEGMNGTLFACALGEEFAALSGWTEHNDIYIHKLSGEMLKRISGLPDVVLRLRLSPNGTVLAAALGTGGFRLYETQDFGQIGAFSSPAACLSVDVNDDKMAAATFSDGHLSLFDAGYGTRKSRKYRKAELPEIFFVRGGKRLLLCKSDGLELIDLSLKVRASLNSTGEVEKAALAAQGQGLYTVEEEGGSRFVYKYSFGANSLESEGRLFELPAELSALVDDGSGLWVAFVDKGLVKYSYNSELLHLPEPYEAEEDIFALSRLYELGIRPVLPNIDERDDIDKYERQLRSFESMLWLFDIGGDKVYVSDWGAGRLNAEGDVLWLTRSALSAYKADVSEDKRVLALLSHSGTLRLLNTENGEEIISLYSVGSSALAVSTAGYYEVFGDIDDRLRLRRHRSYEQADEIVPITVGYKGRFEKDTLYELTLRYASVDRALEQIKNSKLKKEYIAELTAELQRKRRYPLSLRRREIEGDVKLELKIARDGSLAECIVLNEDELYKRLTEEALETVRRVFPRPEIVFTDKVLKVRVTLRYKLE